jgi:hypothetical protein
MQPPKTVMRLTDAPTRHMIAFLRVHPATPKPLLTAVPVCDIPAQVAIKPIAPEGHPAAHQVGVLRTGQQLADAVEALQFPAVLQEFIPHVPVVFKVGPRQTALLLHP